MELLLRRLDGALAVKDSKLVMLQARRDHVDAITRILPGIGREFMPPLDEGSFLAMPSVLPQAALSEVVRVNAAQDAAIATIPEVASVVDVVAADHVPPRAMERFRGYDLVKVTGGTQALRRTVGAELEITESIAMDEPKVVGHTLGALRELGIRVADVEHSIGRRVDHTIVSDGRSVVYALNRGVPFFLSNREAQVSQDVLRLDGDDRRTGRQVEDVLRPQPLVRADVEDQPADCGDVHRLLVLSRLPH